MRLLIPLIVLSLTAPLLAQQTDLEKENRELKEYIERLEQKLAEARARLREKERSGKDRPPPAIPPTQPSPRYHFEMPNPIPPRPQLPPFPWRLDPPSTRPSPAPPAPPAPRVEPDPHFNPAPPPNAHRFRFNGQDVYVIPLE